MQASSSSRVIHPGVSCRTLRSSGAAPGSAIETRTGLAAVAGSTCSMKAPTVRITSPPGGGLAAFRVLRVCHHFRLLLSATLRRELIPTFSHLQHLGALLAAQRLGQITAVFRMPFEL